MSAPTNDASIGDVTTTVEAIRRGVDLLDRHGPVNWRDVVEVDQLYMRSAATCVLGQVYRRAFNSTDRIDWIGNVGSAYDLGVAVLRAMCGERSNNYVTVGVWTHRHGFTVWYLPPDHVSEDVAYTIRRRTWGQLDRGWRAVLTGGDVEAAVAS